MKSSCVTIKIMMKMKSRSKKRNILEGFERMKSVVNMRHITCNNIETAKQLNALKSWWGEIGS